MTSPRSPSFQNLSHSTATARREKEPVAHETRPGYHNIDPVPISGTATWRSTNQTPIGRMVVLAPFREGRFPAILAVTLAPVATCIHGGGHEEVLGFDRVDRGAEYGRRGNVVGGSAIGSAQRQRPPRLYSSRRSGHHQPSAGTVLPPLATPDRWVEAHLSAGDIPVQGYGERSTSSAVAQPRKLWQPDRRRPQSSGATALDRSRALRPTTAVPATRSAMARPSHPWPCDVGRRHAGDDVCA